MDLLYVPADVTWLREARATDVALEGACARVLAEVVTQITRLGKYWTATVVHAPEVHFDALRDLVAHLDVLMQVARYIFEALGRARAHLQDGAALEVLPELLVDLMVVSLGRTCQTLLTTTDTD